MDQDLLGGGGLWIGLQWEELAQVGEKAQRWGVQKCENTMILFWGKNSALHPEIRWSIILVLVLQYLHFSVCSIM